jgi:transcriptional regulator with XRE-family HTH domain
MSASETASGTPHALRRLRKAQGLRLEDVAERAGCNKRSVSEIELGRRVPSIELASRLAAAVGRSPSEVFGEPNRCACGCGELTFSTFVRHHWRPDDVGPDS